MKFNADQITVVIAIAAIISPVIVAIVNDFYNYQLEKSKFRYTQVQKSKNNISNMNKLVSDFITAANVLNTYEQAENWQLKAKARNQFVKCGSKLLPYLSPAYQKVMRDWLKFSQVDDKNDWFKITRNINDEAINLLKDVGNQNQ